MGTGTGVSCEATLTVFLSLLVHRSIRVWTRLSNYQTKQCPYSR